MENYQTQPIEIEKDYTNQLTWGILFYALLACAVLFLYGFLEAGPTWDGLEYSLFAIMAVPWIIITSFFIGWIILCYKIIKGKVIKTPLITFLLIITLLASFTAYEIAF